MTRQAVGQGVPALDRERRALRQAVPHGELMKLHMGLMTLLTYEANEIT